MTAALARILVSVASLEKALPLYEDVLDLRRISETPGVVVLGLARGIEVVLNEGTPTPGEGGIAPHYRVSNVDAAVAAATGVGCTLLVGPADRPWGEREATLRDVDGHVFGIVTPID